MKIWNRVQGAWSRWWRPSAETAPEPPAAPGETHLELAQRSLRGLMEDERVPVSVRQALAEDYRQLEVLMDKLEHGQLHIAVLGRVSVGKSALLNALLGEERFSVSPLHGETRTAELQRWAEHDAGGVYLVDTPGINEVDGIERERLAHQVAERSDLVLFVVDGDLTATELQALEVAAAGPRPVLLVLNKADRYTGGELDLLLQSLERRSAELVGPRNVVAAAAQPAEQVVIVVDEQGRESERRRRPPLDVSEVTERIWDILKAEGQSLAAVNASLFAGRVSDRVAREVLEIKRDIAERVVRKYCLGKGLAVALNPVPVADLLAVAADGAMIAHLAKVYGLPVTRAESGALVRTIAAQLALLMGTVWGVQLLSTALKGLSFGLSTLITSSAQGAVAWYGTYVVGRAAERYFAQGKSWGEGGPKRVVEEILAGIDRDSLLAQAREDILMRLRSPG